MSDRVVLFSCFFDNLILKISNYVIKCALFHQIVGFFDDKYLRKKTIGIWDFSHWHSNQEIASIDCYYHLNVVRWTQGEFGCSWGDMATLEII